MSRFRFRAWDEEAGKFTYSFVEDDNYIWGFEDGKLKAWAIRLNPGTIDEPPYPESVELEPPEMSTGLPDKTGKEIFEGDIIETRFIFGKDVPRGQIKFKAGCFIVEWINDEEGLNDILHIHGPESEIIGNRFENPELLEAANEKTQLL